MTSYYGGTGGNILTITGAYTNDSGLFGLYGTGDVANIGTLVTTGVQAQEIYIGSGATLNLTHQAGGITDIAPHTAFEVYGVFNDVVNGTSALANLTDMDGLLTLGNGQVMEIIPEGGTLTLNKLVKGGLSIGNRSTLTINGNVNNYGVLSTGIDSSLSSGNVLTVTGNLTNDSGAGFELGGGDVASVSRLANNGLVSVGVGATLSLAHQPQGITDVVGTAVFAIAGTFKARR